jgi:hypothetical protein
MHNKVVSKLSRAVARRLHWQRCLELLTTNLFVGLGIGLGLLTIAVPILYLFDHLPTAILLTSLGLSIVLASLARALFQILNLDISELEGAKTLDDRLGLKDRFSSALYFERGQESDMTSITLADVHARAQSLDLNAALSSSVPGQIVGVALFLLLALPLSNLLATYKAPEARIQERRIAARDKDRKLLIDVRDKLLKTAEELQKEAEAEKNEEGSKAAKMLKKAAREISPEEGNDRRSALRKLADKRKELMKKRQGLSFEEALNQAIHFLVRSKFTRPLARKLQQSHFEGAIAATLKLAETLPAQKLSKKETDKLVTAAARASRVLLPTRLKPLGEALAELAEGLRLKDKTLIKKALNKLAKKLKMLKNLKKSRKMIEKALNALELAKLDLSRGRDGKALPFQNFKAPKGARNRADGKQKPLAIRPGPMRKGGGKGAKGAGKAPPMYLGPCSLNCNFEGQCMKCPCRGKKICPKDKKPCPCFYCQQMAQGGGRKGAKGGKGKGPQGKGAGKGKEPGWGTERKQVKPSDIKGLARKTHVKGLLGKKGESAIMAVKTANDGSKASTAAKKIFKEYQKVEEESLYREKVPLSKRDLVRKYFEAIKPKD